MKGRFLGVACYVYAYLVSLVLTLLVDCQGGSQLLFQCFSLNIACLLGVHDSFVRRSFGTCRFAIFIILERCWRNLLLFLFEH